MLERCARHQPEGIDPPRAALLRECDSREGLPAGQDRDYLPPSDLGVKGVRRLTAEEGATVWER